MGEIQISDVLDRSAHLLAQHLAHLPAKGAVSEYQAAYESFVLMADDEKALVGYMRVGVNIVENPYFTAGRLHAALNVSRPDRRPIGQSSIRHAGMFSKFHRASSTTRATSLLSFFSPF
jgi:hypothetical protein